MRTLRPVQVQIWYVPTRACVTNAAVTCNVPKKPLLGEQMAISLDSGQSFKAASPSVSIRLSPRWDVPRGPLNVSRSAAFDTWTAGGTLMDAS